MQLYIFRIMENEGFDASAVHTLIEKYNGVFQEFDTKEEIIYETEFPTEEYVAQFKLELANLLGTK